MSKAVYDVGLLELLPENLRDDPDIIVASGAVDTEFKALTNSIKNCLTIADIDNASSEVVDNLAGEMNVDFYDQASPLAKRRELVKNAYIYKHQKGTAYVVKRIAETAFENVSLVEWFEYNGDPYHFALVFDSSIPDSATLNNVMSAIKSVKNVRSYLDDAQVKDSESTGIYFGCCVVEGSYETITQSTYASRNLTLLRVEEVIDV